MMHRLKQTAIGGWMEIDLTLPQLRTLLILAEEGPLVIGQIAQRLGVGLSTGGHLCDRLEEARLGVRPGRTWDPRRALDRLTPAGVDVPAPLVNPLQHINNLIPELDPDHLRA